MVVPEFADNLSPLEDTLLLRGVYGAAIAEAELQVRRVGITVSLGRLVLLEVQVAHGSLLGLERVLVATEQLEEVVGFARFLLEVPLVEIVLPSSEILGRVNHYFLFQRLIFWRKYIICYRIRPEDYFITFIFFK